MPRRPQAGGRPPAGAGAPRGAAQGEADAAQLRPRDLRCAPGLYTSSLRESLSALLDSKWFCGLIGCRNLRECCLIWVLDRGRRHGGGAPGRQAAQRHGDPGECAGV
jgi:hypothetical protein